MKIAQYADYTMSAKNVVSHQIMTVTPEIAAKWIETGAPNRKPARHQINIFANAMKAGRWEYNGQDIILDRDGHLIDGQHRLLAVIKSGQNVVMGVKRGVPSEAFMTIDSGKARNVADIVSMISDVDRKRAASIARYAHSFDTTGHFAYAATRMDVTDYFIKWQEQIEAISSAPIFHRRPLIHDSSVGVIGFFATRHGVYTVEDWQEFIQPVITGENLKPGDPRFALRDWAINRKFREKGKIDPGRMNHAIIRAWQHYVRGEELFSINVPTGGYANAHIPGQDID